MSTRGHTNIRLRIINSKCYRDICRLIKFACKNLINQRKDLIKLTSLNHVYKFLLVLNKTEKNEST